MVDNIRYHQMKKIKFEFKFTLLLRSQVGAFHNMAALRIDPYYPSLHAT